MKKLNRIAAIVCFALAIIIFVFSSGARQIYSGGFFTILGIVNVIAAMKKNKLILIPALFFWDLEL